MYLLYTMCEICHGAMAIFDGAWGAVRQVMGPSWMSYPCLVNVQKTMKNHHF